MDNLIGFKLGDSEIEEDSALEIEVGLVIEDLLSEIDKPTLNRRSITENQINELSDDPFPDSVQMQSNNYNESVSSSASTAGSLPIETCQDNGESAAADDNDEVLVEREVFTDADDLAHFAEPPKEQIKKELDKLELNPDIGHESSNEPCDPEHRSGELASNCGFSDNTLVDGFPFSSSGKDINMINTEVDTTNSSASDDHEPPDEPQPSIPTHDLQEKYSIMVSETGQDQIKDRFDRENEAESETVADMHDYCHGQDNNARDHDENGLDQSVIVLHDSGENSNLVPDADAGFVSKDETVLHNLEESLVSEPALNDSGEHVSIISDDSVNDTRDVNGDDFQADVSSDVVQLRMQSEIDTVAEQMECDDGTAADSGTPNINTHDESDSNSIKTSDPHHVQLEMASPVTPSQSTTRNPEVSTVGESDAMSRQEEDAESRDVIENQSQSSAERLVDGPEEIGDDVVSSEVPLIDQSDGLPEANALMSLAEQQPTVCVVDCRISPDGPLAPDEATRPSAPPPAADSTLRVRGSGANACASSSAVVPPATRPTIKEEPLWGDEPLQNGLPSTSHEGANCFSSMEMMISSIGPPPPASNRGPHPAGFSVDQLQPPHVPNHLTTVRSILGPIPASFHPSAMPINVGPVMAVPSGLPPGGHMMTSVGLPIPFAHRLPPPYQVHASNTVPHPEMAPTNYVTMSAARRPFPGAAIPPRYQNGDGRSPGPATFGSPSPGGAFPPPNAYPPAPSRPYVSATATADLGKFMNLKLLPSTPYRFTPPPADLKIRLPAQGYTCRDCGDTFALKSSLEFHLQRRSVLIQGNCMACRKAYTFYNRCAYFYHIRKHNENRAPSDPACNTDRRLIQILGVHPITPADLDRWFNDSAFQRCLDLDKLMQYEVDAAKDFMRPPLPPSRGPIPNLPRSSGVLPIQPPNFPGAGGHLKNALQHGRHTMAPPTGMGPPPVSHAGPPPLKRVTASVAEVPHGGPAPSSLRQSLMAGPMRPPSATAANHHPEASNRQQHLPVPAPPAGSAPSSSQNPIGSVPNSAGICISPSQRGLPMSPNSGSGATLKCPECPYHAPNPTVLRDHFAYNLPPQQKQFICHVCQAVYFSQCSYQAHARVHRHVPPHVCAECGLILSSARALQAHFLEHRLGPTVLDAWRCAKCFTFYSSRDALLMHMANAHCESYYKCQGCPMAFKSPQNFQEHRNSEHPADQKIDVRPISKCMECDTVFQVKDQLTGHLKTAHFTELQPFRVYRCPVCGRLMENKSGLLTHFRTNHKIFVEASAVFEVKIKLPDAVPTTLPQAHQPSPPSGLPLGSNGPIPGFSPSASGPSGPKRPKLASPGPPRAIRSCAKCKNFTTADKRAFVAHVKSHVEVNGPSDHADLLCFECGLSFGSSMSLSCHLIHVHKLENVTSALAESAFEMQNWARPGTGSPATLQCDVCHRHCAGREDLARHAKTHGLSYINSALYRK